METTKTCSLILLCGYLGSGKTTLIQYILKTQNTYKVAVIQNEFSDGLFFFYKMTNFHDKALFIYRNGDRSTFNSRFKRRCF